MRVYKLYYPIEDYEDDSWKDMWKEVNIYTEAQMRELCEEYIKDDTISGYFSPLIVKILGKKAGLTQ